MSTKSKILAAFLVTAFVVGGIAMQASAESNEGKGNASSIESKLKHLERKVKSVDFDESELLNIEKEQLHGRQFLVISPNGSIRINWGIITSGSGNTLNVKVWGINLSVDKTDATVVPKEGENLLAVNHLVSVAGTINAETGVIKAKAIRDITAGDEKSGELKARINKLIERLNEIFTQQGKPTIPLLP